MCIFSSFYIFYFWMSGPCSVWGGWSSKAKGGWRIPHTWTRHDLGLVKDRTIRPFLLQWDETKDGFQGGSSGQRHSRNCVSHWIKAEESRVQLVWWVRINQVCLVIRGENSDILTVGKDIDPLHCERSISFHNCVQVCAQRDFSCDHTLGRWDDGRRLLPHEFKHSFKRSQSEPEPKLAILQIDRSILVCQFNFILWKLGHEDLILPFVNCFLCHFIEK